MRFASTHRRAVLGIAPLVAMVALAGCGGTSDTDSSDGDGATGSLPHLTVAMAAVDPSQALGPLALAKGFFKEAGVDVTLIPNAGSNISNMLVSEQADLGWTAQAAAMSLAMQGKDVKVVYAPNGGAPAGTMVTPADSGITDLEQLDGKKVGVIGPGSTSWGYASIYAAQAGIEFDLVPLGTTPSVTAAIASGQVDAAVGSYGSFLGLIQEDRAKVLVDTRDPDQRAEYLGSDWPDGAIFGISDNLDAKREAVVRFIAAVNKALDYTRTASDEQIAKDLRTLPDWEPIAEPLLTQQIKDTKVFWSPKEGEITPEDFSVVIKQLGEFAIPGYDESNPEFDYQKRVDMSMLADSRKINQS